MNARTIFLIAACLFGLAAIVQTLALVGTPEVTRWTSTAGRAAVGSTSVGLLLGGAVICFCLACFARAWRIGRG